MELRSNLYVIDDTYFMNLSGIFQQPAFVKNGGTWEALSSPALVSVKPVSLKISFADFADIPIGIS